jgi:hypothetical protein
LRFCLCFVKLSEMNDALFENDYFKPPTSLKFRKTVSKRNLVSSLYIFLLFSNFVDSVPRRSTLHPFNISSRQPALLSHPLKIMPPNRQHPGKTPKDRQAEYPYHAPNSDPEPPIDPKPSASQAATMSNPAFDDRPLDKTAFHKEPNVQTARNLDFETLRSSTSTLERQILTTILLNDHESLPELLEQHAELSSAMLNSGKYTHWAYLLTAAAVVNHPESIHAFLTRVPGAHALRPSDLDVPLIVALEQNYEKVAEDLLIRLRNRPLANSPFGPAFLARAVEAGHVGIAKVLIDIAGVGVNAPAGGDVALHRAAFLGDDRMVKMLQIRGAAFAMPGLRFANAAEAAKKGGHAFLALQLDEHEAQEISRRAKATQPANEETYPS